MVKVVEYEQMTDTQKLKGYWRDFCDADPVPPEFADEMEAAGLIELQSLTPREATRIVSADPFWATKYGTETPSSIYVLTDAGRQALSEGERP